ALERAERANTTFEQWTVQLRDQFEKQRNLLDLLTRRLEQAVNRIPTAMRLVPPDPTHEDVPSNVRTEAAAAAATHGRPQHLRFLPASGGYQLVEVDGPAPSPGELIDLGSGLAGCVAKVAASPLPNDRRRCAYILPGSATANEQHTFMPSAAHNS
ncbi:MAG: hypothetical protein ACRDLK_10060, partial [Gaiellaceae bacterium]